MKCCKLRTACIWCKHLGIVKAHLWQLLPLNITFAMAEDSCMCVYVCCSLGMHKSISAFALCTTHINSITAYIEEDLARHSPYESKLCITQVKNHFSGYLIVVTFIHADDTKLATGSSCFVTTSSCSLHLNNKLSHNKCSSSNIIPRN